MRIAFILDVFPTLSETFILNQILTLLEKGYKIEVFARQKGSFSKTIESEKNKLKENIHYINIPKSRIVRILKAIFLIISNFYKAPIKILNSLNIFKYKGLEIFYFLIPFLGKSYDIIHSHFGPMGIIGVHLKELGLSGKYITSFHGYDVNSYPNMKGKDIYKNLFAYGDFFTANSNFTKTQVIRLGCDERKIEVLPMGLRIEKFKFSSKNIQSGELIKILTIARLVEKKGHRYVIEALARIIPKYKNIIYIIAGDGPLRRDLEMLALERGIKANVKFLGAVGEEEVIKLYQEAHIFVLTSVTASNQDREGQALVLQEAQACGLPVVSTYHNGIPEGIVDGKSGFLVPEKDVEALAERLEYLIQHPELWPQLGREGRKFVEERYDIRRLTQRLVKIYKALIEDNKEDLQNLVDYE